MLRHQRSVRMSLSLLKAAIEDFTGAMAGTGRVRKLGARTRRRMAIDLRSSANGQLPSLACTRNEPFKWLLTERIGRLGSAFLAPSDKHIHAIRLLGVRSQSKNRCENHDVRRCPIGIALPLPSRSFVVEDGRVQNPDWKVDSVQDKRDVATHRKVDLAHNRDIRSTDHLQARRHHVFLKRERLKTRSAGSVRRAHACRPRSADFGARHRSATARAFPTG